MKYMVEMKIGCEIFDTYREAEIFCGENGIYGENIYEITEDEAKEIMEG